jgi:hypothetical protein
MRWAALVMAVLGLLVGIFAVLVELPEYEEVRREWTAMSGSFGDPRYERVSEARDEIFARVETEGVATIALAALGLILGIIALRKKGGGVAIAAVAASVGAGICGAIIASAPGIF